MSTITLERHSALALTTRQGHERRMGSGQTARRRKKVGARGRVEPETPDKRGRRTRAPTEAATTRSGICFTPRDANVPGNLQTR